MALPFFSLLKKTQGFFPVEMGINLFSSTSSTSQSYPPTESIFIKAQAGIQLMEAVRRGDLIAVKLCIENNTTPPNPNCTVPIESCASRNTLLVNCLVRDDNGLELTPLIVAMHYGKLDIASYLVEEKKADVNKANDVGITALFLCSSVGNLTAVRYLLEQGADVTKTTNSGAGPFFVAAQLGHLDVVVYLHEKGADVIKAANGWSPLCMATQNGHLAVVMYMLAFCDVDVNDLLSPLYLAAAIGHLKLVECLLSHNANVNLASFSGATPLFIAAQNGYPTVVDYLLKKGGNVHKANNNGVTPLDIAIQSSQSNGERSKEYLEVIKSLNDHILKEQNACVEEPITKRPRLRR